MTTQRHVRPGWLAERSLTERHENRKKIQEDDLPDPWATPLGS